MTSAVEAACSLEQVSQELGVELPAAIARLQATAQRVQTRLGEAADSGLMVWHGWQPPAGVVQRGLPLVLLHGGSASWTHWLREMEAFSKNESVMVVGHEPDFSETIAYLLGLPDPDALKIRKTSLTAVQIGKIEPGKGQLQFLVPARLM